MSKRKRGLIALLPLALVIAFVLAASGVGIAAAPNPALSDDLVLIGNGGGTPTQNNIKVLDINAMAVVNTIGGGTSLSNNHGVLVDSSGRYLYNSNAAVWGGNAMRIVKFDLGTLTEVGVYDQYITGLNSGICGIEWQGNDPASGVIWTADMSSGAAEGGLYKFNAGTNQFTGDYIDVSTGADNAATCGIGWNTANTIAYSSLMNAQKTVKLNWPAGTVVTEVADPTLLHMLDVAKTADYAYVAAHKNTTTGVGYIDIYDLSTFTLVNSFATGGDTNNPNQIHDIKVAHSEGFMYVHSREGNPDVATTTGALDGMLFIYDLGGGASPGASMTNPVLIGSIKSETSQNVSCGTQLLTKSNYCGTPTLTVTDSPARAYWATTQDQSAGVLSVDYTVTNYSSNNLHVNTVQVTGAVNTNGVTVSSTTPVSVGNIPASGYTAAVTVKYNVPGGVSSFTTDLALSAKDLCNGTTTPSSGNMTIDVPAPTTALNNDLVLIGNGGTGQNNIKVLDINALSVVNTIGGGTSLSNNHGVLADSSGRYLYNSNAAVATGSNMRIVKFDLGTLSEVGVYDQYITGLNSGLCGIEWQGNDPSTGVIWTADMSTGATQGGLYKFNAGTNQFTGDYIDVSTGADSAATCGIGWNTGNTLAYSSLMYAQKTVKLNWPAGTVVTEVADATWLHMLDVAKTANYAYVAGHKDANGVGYIHIFDLSTFTLVNSFATGGSTANPNQIHDIKVAHNEGYMYVHSREGNPDVVTSTGALDGMLFIYDLVDDGGTATDDGASMTNPVLIGSIKSQTTNNVACGTQLLTKSDYCGTPTLSTAVTGSPYYASAADAAAGVVSVNYTVTNNSAGNLHVNTVQITGAANTNGVTVNSTTPVSVGNIPAGGGTASATVKYTVPAGVTSFSSDLALSVRDLCNGTTTPTSGSQTVTMPTSRSHYATWYDNSAANNMGGNWVMVTNEDTTAATVNIYVGDTLAGSIDNLAVGAVSAWQSPATVTGGPVKVVSANGQALGVSQRVIYKDSFNEVETLAEGALTNEYYFPWYDNNAAGGMNGNWVMIANTGSTATTVDIFISDMTTPVANDVSVGAGAVIAWQSPTTVTNGPVKVAGASSGDKLVVSQRVLYGDAFNEATGIATSRLANEAWFTWYDNDTAGGMNGNWVMVSNVGSSSTTVDIFVGDMTTPKADDVAVAQNGVITWQSSTPLTDGPVKVVGAGVGDKLVVSQRVLYKSSFEETAPTYASELGSNADFGWYDNSTTNGMGGNWVMATNADTTNANVDIAIAGTTAGTLNPVNANGGEGNWISPTTVTNGPVRVTNTGSTKLVISQRVIYKNSFNELVGRPRV